MERRVNSRDSELLAWPRRKFQEIIEVLTWIKKHKIRVILSNLAEIIFKNADADFFQFLKF